jgi:ring-1,2-phenylacetyl-CoA epoxidase subunit PaaC
VTSETRFRYVLRLADTSLVLGQRLGEWVGHAPALEEDLALANIALDLIGQARLLLSYAGEIEGRGRDEDALAFLRDAPEFCNVSLAEQPNGDFGRTIVRQFLLDAWQLELYEAESHARVAQAVDTLWRFTDELLTPDALDEEMAAAGIGPSLPALRARWQQRVGTVLEEATLKRPAVSRYPWHGKRGVHTEHLGHMLAEMQHLPRTFPGVTW